MNKNHLQVTRKFQRKIITGTRLGALHSYVGHFPGSTKEGKLQTHGGLGLVKQGERSSLLRFCLFTLFVPVSPFYHQRLHLVPAQAVCECVGGENKGP